MKVLILESSTTSAKAMFADTRGTERVVARPYGYADTALQDADMVWAKTLQAGKEVLNGENVDIIVLSGTYHSILECDQKMRPLSKVYQWTFTGAAEICDAYSDEAKLEYYKKTGCMVSSIYPSFKLMWMRKKGLPMDGYFLGQGSYNFYRATGKRYVTSSMLSGSGLLSVSDCGYERSVLEQIGVREEQFCELVPYDKVRPLNRHTAKSLGLKEGIPVVPTGPDGGLNQIGAGALKEGVMTFSVGTCGALRLSTKEPKLSEKGTTWVYRSPLGWMSGAATSGCCNCVDWARSLYMGNAPFDKIERELARDPNETPVFLPFLCGERCPGWSSGRRGSFLHMRASHTGADMYHAVLEGILYNLYQCYKELVMLNGEPDEIKLSGGIVHSPYWVQMCADIFGHDMKVADMAQGSMIGAFVLALKIGGEISSVSDFKFRTEKTVRSNPMKYDQYQKKYQSYLQAYESVLQ